MFGRPDRKNSFPNSVYLTLLGVGRGAPEDGIFPCGWKPISNAHAETSAYQLCSTVICVLYTAHESPIWKYFSKGLKPMAMDYCCFIPKEKRFYWFRKTELLVSLNVNMCLLIFICSSGGVWCCADYWDDEVSALRCLQDRWHNELWHRLRRVREEVKEERKWQKAKESKFVSWKNHYLRSTDIR